MGLAEILRELEEPPAAGCDLVDLDRLLKVCGYECYDDGTTLLYAHDGWGSLLTFPRGKRTIPQTRLQAVIDLVKRHSRRDGRL